jgi:cyclic pyranopterin phosphate synthase
MSKALPVAGPGLRPFSLVDREHRRVRYLRLSVTDRCNLRCRYCLPERVTFKPRDELLTFEEIERVVRLFVGLGVNHLRVTGGEPLLRRDLPLLIDRLSRIDGITDLSMTTNATRLAQLAHPLRQAGLERLNVSLDTVDEGRFGDLTRGGDLSEVVAGLDAALDAGFSRIKINAVLIRGQSDDNIPELLAFSRRYGAVLRLIEYMPIGIDEYWTQERFVPIDEARRRLEAEGYEAQPLPDADKPVGGGPAKYWRVTTPSGDSQTVGFVAALTHNFCAGCNRVRLTADGRLRECLSEGGQSSLRDAMRRGEDDAFLLAMIERSLYGKVVGHGFDAAIEGGGVAARLPMSSLGG